MQFDAHSAILNPVSLTPTPHTHSQTDEQPKIKEELAGPLRQMQESARRIARVSKECKLPLDEEEYVQSFRPEMMDVAYAWSKV